MKNFITECALLGAIIIISLFCKVEAYASENTERYVQLSQIEPLFAWPDVNLDHMNTAISLLEQSRTEIVALVGEQYDNHQQDRVQKALYPTQYLSEMITLERLRRALPQNATLLGAKTYQAQLERTIDAYQTYLNVLIPALLQTSRAQNYEGLEYHFGRSSFGYFMSGIRSYRAQSAHVLKLASHRWGCVSEDGLTCVDAKWPEIPKPVELIVDENVFTNDPANIISEMRMNSKPLGQTVNPKWAVTYTHECFSYRPQVYYFLWEFSSGYDVPIWRADVVNDVLVHDHRVTEGTGNGYEKKLDSLGADGYLHQSFTNHYACPDIASDTSLIRAMVSVYQALDGFMWEQSNSSGSDASAQYNKLRSKAAAIIRKHYVSEYLVRDFMYNLNVMMNSYTPEELVAFWGVKQQLALEKMMLAYINQTSNLSRDIMNLVYSNSAIGDYVRYAPWGFLEELLFTRNAPELLLGGSNPSIIYENYPQVEHPRKEISPRLKSYNEELTKIYNPEEFTDILIKGVNAEADLSALQNHLYFK